MSNAEEWTSHTPEAETFEAEFVRMVEKQVRTTRWVNSITWALIIPFMLAIYVGSLLIVLWLGGTWYLWRTESRVETSAQVISLRKTTKKSSPRYRVRYEYQAGERKYEGSCRVSRERYSEMETGDTIRVVYLKSFPWMSRAEVATGKEEQSRAVAFLVSLIFALLPFFWLGKRVYRRMRKIPSGKVIQNAELEAVRTLVQREVDPIPRLILDRWAEQGLKDSRILESSRPWLSWGGGAERIDLLQELAVGTPLWLWITAHTPLADMEEFLRHLDFFCRKVFPAYEELEPLEMAVPMRIMGPDDPRLGPEDAPAGGVRGNPPVLDMIWMVCHDGTAKEQGWRAFRIDLCGLTREDALQEVREGMRPLRTLAFRIEHGRAREQDLERLWCEHYPERFPFIVRVQENEETRGLLGTPEVTGCVHGLLYFFYACPWRWKPIQRDFILVDQEGAETGVRFTFEPGAFIEVERI